MSTHESSTRPGRARGRELALWMLSHVEQAAAGSEREALELFLREPPLLDPSDEFLAPNTGEVASLIGDEKARRWASRLLEIYMLDPRTIDADIEAASQRWRLERMDRVDRNLLRLVAIELRGESTPRNVVISEAVRLAARYGNERSPSFVNGLAEALARTLRDAKGSEEKEPGSS